MVTKVALIGSLASVQAASVTAGSNFFAAHQSTVTGDSEVWWVQYASATNSVLEVVIDDGGGSTVTSVMADGATSSTNTVTAAIANYFIPIVSKFSYNFSPSVSGTTVLFAVFRVLD